MKLEATAANQPAAFPQWLQRVEEDLEWFWNWAEGELDAPSNYSAMINAIRVGPTKGGGQVPDGIDNGRLAAATRVRLITRALERVAPLHQRVLHAAFGPSAHELPLLGKAAPVAPLTTAAQAAHRDSHTTRTIEEYLVRLTHRASNRLGAHVEEDRATARAITAEANQMLTSAMRAFADAHAVARSTRAVQRQG
jgi:hypothetical protein